MARQIDDEHTWDRTIRGDLFGDRVTVKDKVKAKPDFQGDDYERDRDRGRLTGQILRVYDAILPGRWRTLSWISSYTGDGEASISAQLRNLRKRQFGSHRIGRRHIDGGLYEYRLED